VAAGAAGADDQSFLHSADGLRDFERRPSNDEDQPQAEQVIGSVAVNNHGSGNLFEALAPLLNGSAWCLMVASPFGWLSNMPEHLHSLVDTDRMSPDEVEASMDSCVTFRSS